MLAGFASVESEGLVVSGRYELVSPIIEGNARYAPWQDMLSGCLTSRCWWLHCIDRALEDLCRLELGLDDSN